MDPTHSAVLCPTCGRPLQPDGSCPECEATRDLTEIAARPEFTGPKQVGGYKILRELGAGGMGAVYEAHDSKMNRRVALKVLSRHHAPSEKSALRFEQEAWIAGKLDHPNIVKVYERGQWEELSYFSMEVVDGGSLHDVVANLKRWGRDDRWNLEAGSAEYIHWAIKQIVATARALDYAHRQGVVHRDIKPMNLLLSRELGGVKIADFGLAVEADATRMTTAGKILGTLSFMAPEQMLGKQDQIDARTDVYALGVTLFQLLTLELPFRGETQQLYMNAALTSEARRPSKLNQRISRDLEVVIGKALEKRRRDRYATAAAFADDLENVLRLRPIQARPSGWLKKTMKWVQRKPIHAALLATLIVAVPTVTLLARREVQRGHAERQDRIDELVREARWHEERKQCGDVLDRAERILTLDPGSGDALTFRALCRTYLAATADDRARPALERGALQDAARLVELEPQTSYPHRLLAHVFRRLGREEEAEREDRLATQFRSTVQSDRELALDARLAFHADEFGTAIELYSELILRTPDDALSVASRGAAYDYSGNYDQAYQEYRMAIALNPELDLFYINIGILSEKRGNLEEAEGYFRRAVELSPSGPQAHEALAAHLIKRGQAVVQQDPTAARGWFQEAGSAARESIRLLEKQAQEAGRPLEQEPERAWAYVNLGSALIERARLLDPPDPELLDEAARTYEHVLSLWDAPPTRLEEREAYVGALTNTCDVLIELERLERALQVCTEVSDLQPDSDVAFYNLAGVHAMSGHREEALIALRRDLELGDTDWAWLVEDRWFADLRDDPDFLAIVSEMKRSGEN